MSVSPNVAHEVQTRGCVSSEGKSLVFTDVLSWSTQNHTEKDTDTQSEVKISIAAVIQGIPASPSQMETIKSVTAADYELETVITHKRTGWPEYCGNVPLNVRAYKI